MKARIAIAVVLLLAPMVALGSSSWDANAALVYLGMLPALNALMVQTRVAVVAAFLTPVSMVVALALRDIPWAGALYMAAVGVAVGLSARRGWHVVGAFIGPSVAFALLGAPLVALPSGTVSASSSLTSALVFGAWVAFGGLWSTLVARDLVTALKFSGPPPVSDAVSRTFAVAMGSLAGIATFIAMVWFDTPYAWWLLLTVFVVVQPFYSDALAKTAQRTAGTVAGAALAAVVVIELRPHPLVVTVMATLLTVVALWANAKRPYWEFALFLTPAVVLKTSGGVNDVLDADLDRALFTVVGAVTCVVVLTLGHWVIRRIHPEGVDTPNEAATKT